MRQLWLDHHFPLFELRKKARNFSTPTKQIVLEEDIQAHMLFTGYWRVAIERQGFVAVP